MKERLQFKCVCGKDYNILIAGTKEEMERASRFVCSQCGRLQEIHWSAEKKEYANRNQRQ